MSQNSDVPPPQGGGPGGQGSGGAPPGGQRQPNTQGQPQAQPPYQNQPRGQSQQYGQQQSQARGQSQQYVQGQPQYGQQQSQPYGQRQQYGQGQPPYPNSPYQGQQYGPDPRYYAAGGQYDPWALPQGTKISIGDGISTTFRVYKERFFLFWALTVVGGLPLLLATFFQGGSNVEMYAESPFGSGPLFGFAFFISIILSMCVQGAISYSVYKIQRGEEVGFSDSLLQSLKRLGSMFLIALEFGAIAFGLIAVSVLITMALAKIHIVLGVLAGIALVFLGVWLLLSLSLAIPVCVVERLGPVDSLNRSRELTSGNLGQIFVIFLVLSMIAGMVSVIISLPLIGFGLGGGFFASIGQLLATVITDIPFALTMICGPVIYYQLRSVKENFNIFAQADIFD